MSDAPDQQDADRDAAAEAAAVAGAEAGAADVRQPADARRVLADRLEDAGLSTQRFIPVHDGSKASTDHDNRAPDSSDLSGNYGVYGGGGLVDVDIDDYGEGGENAGLDAIHELPETFTIASPHTDGDAGGHSYYHVTVDGDRGLDAEDVLAAADVAEDSATADAARDDETALAITERFGKPNLAPSWGEVRAVNQYVVGPGSQISDTGCDKDWCDACAGCDKDWCDACAREDGGYYRIANDAEIATVTFEELADALEADEDVTAADGGGVDADDGDAPDVTTSTSPKTGDRRDAPDEFVARRHMTLGAVRECYDKADRYLSDGPAVDFDGDRSKADYFVIAKAACFGVSKEDVAETLRDCPHSKVGARDAASDYFSRTWESVIEDDSVDHYTGGKTANQREADGDEVASTIFPQVPDHCDIYVDGGTNDPLPDWEEPDDVVSTDDWPATDEESAAPVALGGGYGELTLYLDNGKDNPPCYSFNQWTNFVISPNRIMRVDDGEHQLDFDVVPLTDEDAFSVQVSPEVFGEVRDFKAEVVSKGLTTTLTGGQWALDHLKALVDKWAVPRLDGVRQKGLHADEFVFPDGVVTEDGWVEDPDTIYVEDDVEEDSKFALAPDACEEFDRGEVADILELLPETRSKERLLPVIGWFYSAPLRPHITDWTGQFSHLNVLGGTDAGKTMTLKVLYQMFGWGTDGISAGDASPFTKTRQTASSNAVPVWYDEYKPAGMYSSYKDKFHSLLRETAMNGVHTRGNPDQSTTTYELRAPIVVSGEQRIQGPAERRRCVMTTFRKASSDSYTDTARAYKRLVGETFKPRSGDIESFDGFDFQQHALAYYQWVAGRDVEELRGLWRQCEERAYDVLADAGYEDIGEMERQGVQTVIFGLSLYRTFADNMGVEDVARDVFDGGDVEDAAVYAASIHEDSGRTDHLGQLVELFARAAGNDLLDEEEDYKFMRGGELRINVSRAFDGVSKFAQDFDVTGVDLFDSAKDYTDRIEEAAEADGGYVTTHQQNTPPISRCMGIDVDAAEDELEAFEKARFKDDDPTAASGGSEDASSGDSASSGGAGPTDLSTIDTGMQTLTRVVVAGKHSDPPDWLAGKGNLVDQHDNPIEFVCEDVDPMADYSAGDVVTITNAKVRTDGDGINQVVLDHVARVTPAPSASDDGDAGRDAAADGGRVQHDTGDGDLDDQQADTDTDVDDGGDGGGDADVEDASSDDSANSNASGGDDGGEEMPQADARDTVMAAVNAKDGDSHKGGAVPAVLSQAQHRGVDEDRAKHILGNLVESGEVRVTSRDDGGDPAYVAMNWS